MSNARHLRRADVLLHALDRAIEETSLTEDDFAERLAVAYEDVTPEDGRKIQFRAPRVEQEPRTFKDLHVAANARLRRYRRSNNPHPIPADLEEAWLYALPEPYATRARQTVARRLGFLGAERTDSPSCSDASLLPSLCKESGEAIASIGHALANGRIDADNLADAPEMIRELDELIAAATSAKACVIERTGYRESPTPTLTAVSA